MKTKLYVPVLGFTLFLLFGCNSSGTISEEMEKYELTDLGHGSYLAQLRDADGNVIEEGYFDAGKRHGSWLKLNPSEGYITALQNYYKGYQQGVSLLMDDRLQIIERANYAGGKLDGYAAKYRNGRVKLESNYKNGQFHGRVTKYHERGRNKILSESDYREGVQHGIYRYYDDKGNITLDYQYENGEKVTGGIVEPKKE